MTSESYFFFLFLSIISCKYPELASNIMNIRVLHNKFTHLSFLEIWYVSFTITVFCFVSSIPGGNDFLFFSQKWLARSSFTLLDGTLFSDHFGYVDFLMLARICSRLIKGKTIGPYD